MNVEEGAKVAEGRSGWANERAGGRDLQHAVAEAANGIAVARESRVQRGRASARMFRDLCAARVWGCDFLSYMMDQLHKTRPENSVASMQALEGRCMLSTWNASAQLIDQDVAAAKYRNIDGRGQTVAVIDTGVDYNHPGLGGGWL